MTKIGNNKDFQLLPQETQFQENPKFRQKDLIIVFFVKNLRYNIVDVFWVVLFQKTANKCVRNTWVFVLSRWLCTGYPGKRLSFRSLNFFYDSISKEN